MNATTNSSLYLCVIGNPVHEYLRLAVTTDPVRFLARLNDGDPNQAFFYESLRQVDRARSLLMRLCYALRQRRANGHWFKLSPPEMAAAVAAATNCPA